MPVYKDDDESCASNYRPISLLSIFNRIFEKLMYQRLSKFIIKHNILINSQYGFSGGHNTQHVILEIVNTIQSNMNSETTLYGVPQGSVLGPLLFLLYVNDIANSSKHLSFYLFADDTSIIYANKNLHNLEQIVNSELSNVSDWLLANKLTLNFKKSNYVLFRPR